MTILLILKKCPVCGGKAVKEKDKDSYRCTNCNFQWYPRIVDAGQAAVEFTLIFLLMLVVAWIPADFGLYFFTNQIAQNAAREGARIAAADPTMTTQTGTCTLPCSGASDLLRAVAVRLATAPMGNKSVTLSQAGAACNVNVTVQVAGTYNFYFYRLLNWFGVGPAGNALAVTRASSQRWEHQC